MFSYFTFFPFCFIQNTKWPIFLTYFDLPERLLDSGPSRPTYFRVYQLPCTILWQWNGLLSAKHNHSQCVNCVDSIVVSLLSIPVHYKTEIAEINFQSINLFSPAKKIPEIHKFAVYFLFILFYFILHVRHVVLWINNCGSKDLGCFCSAFPPTSDFLCPLRALSPFLFLSSLCSRGAIVSQHHTLRFKTKQNQQTTIHLFSLDCCHVVPQCLNTI